MRNESRMSYAVLVVGGSGGIGREICRQEASEGNIVTATWHKNKPECSKNISYQNLDLSNEVSMNNFLTQLGEKGRKYKRIYFASAINGLGNMNDICSFRSGEVPIKADKYMRINCYSIIKIIHQLVYYGLADETAKMCALTSIAGSSALRGLMVHNQSGGNLAYRISKSALNCSIRNIGYDLECEGSNIIVCTVYPGWVRTSSSSPDAPNTPSVAVTRLMSVMSQLSARQNGLMLDLDGIPLPF